MISLLYRHDNFAFGLPAIFPHVIWNSMLTGDVFGHDVIVSLWEVLAS